jgi:GTPase involved in cell partitioning and DNA repair
VLNNPIDVVKSRIQAGSGGVGIVGAMREVRQGAGQVVVE